MGVILQGLQPETSETIRLYTEKSYEKDKRLMAAIDKLSQKYGRDTVSFGFKKAAKCWQMKAEMKSQRFTTCLKEIVQVR